jgi:hypothetical protein
VQLEEKPEMGRGSVAIIARSEWAAKRTSEPFSSNPHPAKSPQLGTKQRARPIRAGRDTLSRSGVEGQAALFNDIFVCMNY